MKGHPDIGALPDGELVLLTRELGAELRGVAALIEPAHVTRKRTRRLLRGTALNFAGLAAAVPTGGISLLLCAGGLLDWADALVEDANAMNDQLRYRRIYLEKQAFLAHVQAELKRRGLC
jgi:hypothetical protein